MQPDCSIQTRSRAVTLARRLYSGIEIADYDPAMARSVLACWTIIALSLGTALGGARMLCISFAPDACGIAQADSCCSEPVDQGCPPTPDGEDCCIDIVPPTLGDTVGVRVLVGRDHDSTGPDSLPTAILAIPPPRDSATLPGVPRVDIAGPPRDILATVRTSVLLL